MKNTMKKVALVLAVAVSVCILATVASATTITYNWVDATEYNANGNTAYDLTVGVKATDTDVVGTFYTMITFDNDVVIPVTSEDYDTPIALAEGEVENFDPFWTTSVEVGSGKNKKTYVYDQTQADWTTDGNKTTVEFSVYTTGTAYFDYSELDFMTIAFKLADGYTPETLTTAEITIDQIFLAAGLNADGKAVEYGYQFKDAQGNVRDLAVLDYENNLATEPVVEETYWGAGNGFNLVDMDGNVVANNSPVTKTEKSATEVTVKYGGYYQGADNWAGAALKDAVTVDGLEIEVTYTALPSSTDCWAFIGVLANPSIFSTKSDAYNNGYVNLIRYTNGNMSVHGTTKWETVGTYGDGFFALENGDVLRVCFDKNEEGTYDITYVKNNTEVFALPIAIDLEAALGGTTGYVVASASCKGSEANAFEYTVNTDPEELAVAKIPVVAGDTVYEYAEDASYTITKVAENGTYNILLTNNDYITVIVNSGYTSQKAYSVSKAYADGYFVEVEDVANGVLGSDELSVRIRSNAPQGIRFFGTVKNVIAELDNFDEYGFIMTAESTYNALPDDYVLDMALVEAGKAKKGVAKDTAGTDIYFERTTEATVIAGVFYGVPKTVEGVKTVIASRPYYKLGDACVYGEVTKATLYDIAKLIYNVEGYEVAWEYAKEIIEIVEGPMTDDDVPELDNEIAIDVSELYK